MGRGNRERGRHGESEGSKEGGSRAVRKAWVEGRNRERGRKAARKAWEEGRNNGGKKEGSEEG